MPGEIHRKAAELHERAAHAHRVAATHQEQGEQLTSSELSRQALEHAEKAFQCSQEAHRIAALLEGLKLRTQTPSAAVERELVGPVPGKGK